jgi:hypothetical protein
MSSLSTPVSVAFSETIGVKKPQKKQKPTSAALIKKARRMIDETVEIVHEREQKALKLDAYVGRAIDARSRWL